MPELLPEIVYDSFAKVDLRAGTISGGVRVPKSEKLLQLEVNFGELGSRTILAGLGKDFEPEQLIGKNIIAVVNLVPRKMMGIESHGMIVATTNAEGKLVLPSCPDAPPGAKLG